MAKEQEEPVGGDDIPAWFMTYSDVITLLMTFFILLLTFATTEPERFEKIQVAMFGGSGSTGIAGEQPEGIEKDSFVQRTRPPSARMCLQGSEMPPINSDPSLTTAEGALSGLDDDEAVDLSKQYAIQIDIVKFVGKDGDVYSMGEVFAKMFAQQLYKLPLHITFEASGDDAVQRCVALTNFIFDTHGIKPGQMGVRKVGNANARMVRIVVQHHLLKTSR